MALIHLIISFFPFLQFIFENQKRQPFICIVFLLISIIFFSFGISYKQKFLASEIKENPYIIRVIGSNISLDRFYKNSDTEIVIKRLIKLISPDRNKRII